MEEHNLTNEQILAFSTALFQAERSQATVEKYLRSVRAFSLFLDGRPVTKDTVLAWKKSFLDAGILDETLPAIWSCRDFGS